ncbi:hypothetical protein GYMLUDRAFT_65419 [Collybiopsis luxurians FD-317 M1]|uniref:Uncharacterized protein n=1 Tax=Collybiopsis luxurians FD-317 M1 TaxID=944289 RepID=A0A0D0AIX7_9AGAR|nr:hypothetical protein GYMLUDRAFT_65419 [Collybiopsis luxurians FD-317 M1]
MTIIKLLFFGIYFTIPFVEIFAAPQTVTSAPSVVTLYDVISPEEASILNNTSDWTPLYGTIQLTATVVGVSSGSNGSETTYSFGEYISQNRVFATTSTDSQGQLATQTVTTPELVVVSNWTLVESDRGFWETRSPQITSNLADGGTLFAEGNFLSCSFDSSHQSALCTGIDLEPVLATVTSGSQIATVTEARTFPESYGGSITAFTVITAAVPSNTGSSNAATGRHQEFGLGGYIFVGLAVSLYALFL